MQIFVYEFITGGGQFSLDDGSPAESLLAEGRAMASALTADFAAIPGVRVWTLRDSRVPAFHANACNVHEVHGELEGQQAVSELSRSSDWTLLIAPEMSQLLSSRAAQVCNCGGRLISPDASLIELASDKQATAEHLAAHGVQCPSGKIVGRGSNAQAYEFPAVIKPNDGCGSLGVRKLTSGREFWQYVQQDSQREHWRLERLVAGKAASVAVLCGPRELIALPACEQIQTGDGSYRYLGGRLPLDEDLDARARRLAIAAAQTLTEPRGYIGLDIVFGASCDGSEDYVIEINPRLSTSYIGLRALCRTNLAAAMLAVAQGQPAALSWRDGVVQFSADGEIDYQPRLRSSWRNRQSVS